MSVCAHANVSLCFCLCLYDFFLFCLFLPFFFFFVLISCCLSFFLFFSSSFFPVFFFFCSCLVFACLCFHTSGVWVVQCLLIYNVHNEVFIYQMRTYVCRRRRRVSLTTTYALVDNSSPWLHDQARLPPPSPLSLPLIPIASASTHSSLSPPASPCHPLPSATHP